MKWSYYLQWIGYIDSIESNRWVDSSRVESSHRSLIFFFHSLSLARSFARARLVSMWKCVLAFHQHANMNTLACALHFNFTTEYIYWICGGMFNVSIKKILHAFGCLHRIQQPFFGVQNDIVLIKPCTRFSIPFYGAIFENFPKWEIPWKVMISLIIKSRWNV